jgi:lysozyme family protein
MTLWERVADSIIGHEGGYVNHPTDPGGETNWGISKRSYPHVDIKNLTREQALEIYREDYWDYIPEDLPDVVRWFAFDCAVNHGLGRALEWLEDSRTVAELAATRLFFYSNLSTWPTFGKGWVRRVANLLWEINAWAEEHDGARSAEVVVLHDLVQRPVTLRGKFVWRTRGQKIDIRWVGPIEE